MAMLSSRLYSRRSFGTLTRVAATAALAIVAGCASNGPITVAATPGPRSDTTMRRPTPTGSASTGSTAGRAVAGWRLDTREHVDLWLHGFALLQDDASLVPYFRLGYRAALGQVRPSTGGQFDANRAQLQRRFVENANLTSAQFLALYFASWDDLRRGVDRFVRDNGDVRMARTQDELRMYATVRTYFPTAEDREWLRLFVQSLDDERSRFYRGYWIQQQQRRASMRSAIEALWTGTYGGAFSRFMRNSVQREGTILLSLPLGGEGRTLAVGGNDNFMAVNFPAQGDDPREALYAVAHEVVGTVATAAVRDNASAADERSGDTGKWTTLAAVRGGAMLLQRIAPDLLAGYQRYYLTLARVPAAQGDPAATFAATFPLPAQIVTALQRQIDVVLGGI
jgi:hypothetical protein